MAEYTDRNGVVHTGLKAHNAKRADDKFAAAQAATTAPAPATAPKDKAPRAPKAYKAPAPATDPTPTAPAGGTETFTEAPMGDTAVTAYDDILFAVKTNEPGFELQSRAETAGQFIARLAAAALALPDGMGADGKPDPTVRDLWGNLAEDSQMFLNRVAEAMNAEPAKPIPTDLEGFVDKHVASATSGTKPKLAKPKLAKPKLAKEKGAKAPKEGNAEKAPRAEGAVAAIYRFVISKAGNCTTAEIVAHVAAMNLTKPPKATTCGLSGNFAKQFVRYAQEMGHWKD
jgi:hypothetical protein